MRTSSPSFFKPLLGFATTCSLAHCVVAAGTNVGLPGPVSSIPRLRSKLQNPIKTQIQFLILAASLFTATVVPLHAQLVADGATNTLSNVTNTITGDVTVGTNGSFTLLVLSDNSLLTNSVNGIIGRNSTARSNVMQLTGASARWGMGSNLYVGSNGAFNQLVVSNGLVENVVGIVGSGAVSSNNLVTITGFGSFWSNRSDIFVGAAGSNNRLIISNGADVYNSRGVLGSAVSSVSNSVLFTAPGSLWVNTGGLTVGESGSGNNMVVSNGAILSSSGETVIGRNSSASGNSISATGPETFAGFGIDTKVGAAGSFNRLICSNGAEISGFACTVGNSGNSNEVIVTSPGTVLELLSLLLIGNSGDGNRLVITNGGQVRCGDGFLGLNLPGRSEVLVSGAGSVWSNKFSVEVGSSGRGNNLTVSDNGVVVVGNSLTIGSISAASTNNRVTVSGGVLQITNAETTCRLAVQGGTNVLNSGLIDADLLVLTNARGKFEFNGGTLVTRGASVSNNLSFVVGAISGPTPAIWDVRAGPTDHVVAAHVYVGLNTPFNQLFVTNGATLTNLLSFNIGGAGNSNSATISGPGSRCASGGIIDMGGVFNRLIVSNGGSLIGRDTAFIGGLFSSSNQVQITGSGSVWNQLGSVSFGGVGNQLLVTNGGLLVCSNAFESIFSSGTNLTLVAGPGSVMNCIDTLGVGGSGRANQLQITNGGTVTVGNSLLVGANSTSSNNLVLVDNGTLRVTNLSGTGLLELRRGSNVFNAGLIETDILRMTNGTQSKFDFKGGTLSVKSSRVSIGPPLIVGDGTSPATLNLAGNGTHDFSGTLGLNVANNATLTGSGSLLVQLQMLAGSQLVPGVSIGRIFLSTPPFLSGATIMEISKNGAVLTNDQIQVTGTLNYGGSLTVSNLGPTALAAGDRFPLFSANSYAGAFSALTLPPLPVPLSWTNKLLVDGSIEVIGPGAPKFTGITVSGTNVVISGTNGVAGQNYAVLTATNVALPSSNWVSLVTNQFGPGGQFAFTNGIVPTEPQRFFRLRTP